MFQLLFSNRCIHCSQYLSTQSDLSLCPICTIELYSSKWNKSSFDILSKRIEDPSHIINHYSLFPLAPASITHELIHEIKYRGNKKLCFHLGQKLGEHIQANLEWPIDFITPIPLHLFRQLKRSYNQSFILAKGISSQMNVPVLECIKRIKNTKTQTKLSRSERLNNLKACFRFRSKFENLIMGKTVLIVDDVVTTGTTLSEISTILPKSQLEGIYSCSVALSMDV